MVGQGQETLDWREPPVAWQRQREKKEFSIQPDLAADHTPPKNLTDALMIEYGSDIEARSRVKASTQHSLLSIQQNNPNTPLIIICTSLIGGTGGAIALDVAYLVRHILATVRMNPYDGYILGAFAIGNVFASALSSAPEEQHRKYLLNEVAVINKIQHFARTRYEFGLQGHVITFDNLEPFNSYWQLDGDRSGIFEGKWPTDYFSLIATKVSDTVITGNWIMHPKRLEYVNIQAPLTTNVIGDWSYWEDV